MNLHNLIIDVRHTHRTHRTHKTLSTNAFLCVLCVLCVARGLASELFAWQLSRGASNHFRRTTFSKYIARNFGVFEKTLKEPKTRVGPGKVTVTDVSNDAVTGITVIFRFARPGKTSLA